MRLPGGAEIPWAKLSARAARVQRPSARRERRRAARPLIWQGNDIADDPHTESSGTRVTCDCRAPVRSSGPVRRPIRRRDRSALGPRGVPLRHPRTLLGVARDPASRCGWGRCCAVLNRQWERAASRLRLSAGSVRARHGRRFVVVALTAAIGGLAVSDARPASAPSAHYSHEGRPQTAWAACNRNARNKQPSTFTPLSDAKAAALVTPEPETRPYNARPYTILGKRYPAANDYVPTAAQIRRYRDSRTSSGQALLKFNPYTRYVDGRDGMRHPSTDDLIQWAAHKWGIPENWLRAEYVVESYWNHFNLGDDTKVSSRWYPLYPYQSRIPHTSNVYQSLGITQVRWAPDGSLGAGTEPLRWESTAFNVDEQAATIRFYYDNPSGSRSSWGDRTYAPCQAWPSIGGWYNPYPWGNAGQAGYIKAVRGDLDARDWASSSFLDWSPSSLPRGIRFR